jgi:hypothetical protein
VSSAPFWAGADLGFITRVLVLLNHARPLRKLGNCLRYPSYVCSIRPVCGPARNKLLKCFEREQVRWPQLTLFDAEGDTRIWSREDIAESDGFVTVQALEREVQFVVEVAWNETEEFPWGAFGKSKVDQSQGGRFGKVVPAAPVWNEAPEETVRMRQRLEALCEGKAASIAVDPPPLAQTIRASCRWLRCSRQAWRARDGAIPLRC